MSNSYFWRVFAVAVAAGLFYVGAGVGTNNTVGLPSVSTPARANDNIARSKDSEYIFTASQDGRRIFIWQHVGAKPPKYIGESEAVLEQ